MSKIEKFSKRLDKIFKDGNPTKALILDAFIKNSPITQNEMNEKLYKLLCCLLPYDVKVMNQNMGREYCLFDTLKPSQLIFGRLDWFKPLLMSELRDEDYAKIWFLLVGGSDINPMVIAKGKEFMKGSITVLTTKKVMSSVMSYLYSIHYAFNIDKSLYIEKPKTK